LRIIRENGDRDHLLNDQLVDMDFRSFNPIFNIGGIFFMIGIYLSLIVLAVVLKIIIKVLQKMYPNYEAKSIRIFEKREERRLKFETLMK
jgi:heme exporter protein D